MTQDPLSEQTNVQLIEQLIATYKLHHPWENKGNHTLTSPTFLQDTLSYTTACSQWVQEQAKEQHVLIHIYRIRMSKPEPNALTQDHTCYLFKDTQEVCHEVSHQECYNYVLTHINNEDLCCEDQIRTPQSGQELRRQHNKIEEAFAKNAGYKPEYSFGPGPFSERKPQE